jgi:hypothetical protein
MTTTPIPTPTPPRDIPHRPTSACGSPRRSDVPWTKEHVAIERIWSAASLGHSDVFARRVRLEIANRIRLWRALSGQPTFDVDYWLTRLENQVQASASLRYVGGDGTGALGRVGGHRGARVRRRER